MSSIYFSNYQLKENTEYFLYIGELKNYGLNLFLKEALDRNHDKKVDFIAIVPDLAEQYNYENLIVVNPRAQSPEAAGGNQFACRVSAKEFMTAVSRDPDIRILVDQILERQDNLFLYMYESLMENTLDEIKGVSILGPEKQIAKFTNNKIHQLNGLKDQVPVVDFKICKGYQDLIATTDGLWDKWRDGIFVTKEYSAAGINSCVAFSSADIIEKFADQDVNYIITRFLPHTLDPTVLAVVANPEEVYIAGVADQRIENGNRFTGSTFPSVVTLEQAKRLEEYTRKVGKWLAQQGYKGIYGCDYIITHDGDIRFLEINARKQGTTLEFCCTLDQNLAPGCPNLPELEYFAVTRGRFPENTQEPPGNLSNIHWGTYNYKIHEPVKTLSYIPQQIRERQAFGKIASGCLKKSYLILEHTGSDFIIAQGSFIGRVVALGHDHKSVAQGINLGCQTIELTFTRQNTEKEYVGE